jgi:hypothetical protein
MTAIIVRHPPFTMAPEMTRLAEMLVRDIRSRGDAVDTFILVDCEFPNLSCYEFTRVAILAESLAMQPEGPA